MMLRRGGCVSLRALQASAGSQWNPKLYLCAVRALSSSSQLRSAPAASSSNAVPRPRRSMLYVPGSSDKMIRKSHDLKADSIILDLEDSVADHKKGAAREAVLNGINSFPRSSKAEVAVRINPPSGDQVLAGDDLDLLLPSHRLECVVLLKVEHESDVFFALSRAQQLRPADAPLLELVLSIESASSLLRLQNMLDTIRSATAGTSNPQARVSALLFASEDFCHSAGITRTRSRRELLFPRQQMALIARAYGLGAIDMVCIDYQDQAYLEEECRDGMEIGYDGKQAIHPSQVDTIQQVFSPSDAEIQKAVQIKHAYEEAVKLNRGAVGVTTGDRTLMIDAPMLKQADAVIARAVAAGKPIPSPKS